MNTPNVHDTQRKEYFTLFLVSNMEEIDCYTGYNKMTKEILNGLLDKCVKYNLTHVYFHLCVNLRGRVTHTKRFSVLSTGINSSKISVLSTK